MLVKVTDTQFNRYIDRLSRSINNTSTMVELSKLQPSLIMAQRQATTSNRAFRVLFMLQDFNAKCKHFDKLHITKGFSCMK